MNKQVVKWTIFAFLTPSFFKNKQEKLVKFVIKLFLFQLKFKTEIIQNLISDI